MPRTSKKSTEELADRLHSAAIHLLRRVRRQDQATGLGPAQLSALSVVVFAGPITLGELAAAEQVRPPTMTRIAAALLRARLVERLDDAQDRRIVRLRATARGRRLLQAGRARRVAVLAERLRLLDAADAQSLASALRALERLLQDWS